MYLLSKNLTVPEFLNAAAAAAGILQLSINSIADIRRRVIRLMPTLLLGATGLLCRLGLVLFFPDSSPAQSASSFALDMVKKLICLILLAFFSRISEGGIGGGDLISLASLACCCSFPKWAAAAVCGFFLAFVFAAALFLSAVPRGGRRSGSSGFPFLPFLLGGCLIAAVIFPEFC